MSNLLFEEEKDNSVSFSNKSVQNRNLQVLQRMYGEDISLDVLQRKMEQFNGNIGLVIDDLSLMITKSPMSTHSNPREDMIGLDIFRLPSLREQSYPETEYCLPQTSFKRPNSVNAKMDKLYHKELEFIDSIENPTIKSERGREEKELKQRTSLVWICVTNAQSEILKLACKYASARKVVLFVDIMERYRGQYTISDVFHHYRYSVEFFFF
ncbi:hypothetical protein RFI_31707 [Reticulomyxa filosa]|uniref:Uncharacterized protein n=1 Tax=Reticulomyxa filosa TaxID=46433 RepID=X6LUS1_RETFI|nr:hypothetical protein RFI_31707 [Reticulomyxa filosa]|eukprot:ETO05688.1 hypothetical protein RFI_31707 [Reticulomyxa filosa]